MPDVKTWELKNLSCLRHAEIIVTMLVVTKSSCRRSLKSFNAPVRLIQQHLSSLESPRKDSSNSKILPNSHKCPDRLAYPSPCHVVHKHSREQASHREAAYKIRAKGSLLIVIRVLLTKINNLRSDIHQSQGMISPSLTLDLKANHLYMRSVRQPVCNKTNLLVLDHRPMKHQVTPDSWTYANLRKSKVYPSHLWEPNSPESVTSPTSLPRQHEESSSLLILEVLMAQKKRPNRWSLRNEMPLTWSSCSFSNKRPPPRRSENSKSARLPMRLSGADWKRSLGWSVRRPLRGSSPRPTNMTTS